MSLFVISFFKMKLTLHFIQAYNHNHKKKLEVRGCHNDSLEEHRLSWASINTVGVFVTPPDPNIWDWHHLSCVTELSGSGRLSHLSDITKLQGGTRRF